MNRLKRQLLFVFVSGVLSSCIQRPSLDNYISEYYNLDSLITVQVKSLTLSNPTLHKSAQIDESSEEKRFQLDSVGWARELLIFREADINKPAYSKAYETLNGLIDVGSNLHYDEYKPFAGDMSVRYIRIYYLDEIRKIKKIAIHKKEDNELFFSSLTMEMHFKGNGTEMLLDAYRINGIQKLWLKDTVFYSVAVDIDYE